MNRSLLIAIIVAVAVVAGGAGIYSVMRDKPDKSSSSASANQNSVPPVQITKGTPTPQKDGYLPYVTYKDSKDVYTDTRVVYYFTMSACATCQDANESIVKDESAIPDDIVIVAVNMDDDTDQLRTKYNVTMPHQFVQVDKDGNEVTRWGMTVALRDILGKVK